MKSNSFSRFLKNFTLVAIITITATSCEIDDFTTEVNNVNAPTISMVDLDAIDTISAQVNNEIKIRLSDNDPGLSLVTMDLVDMNGHTVLAREIKLTGTVDTVSLSLKPETLEIGQHTLQVMVQDTEGLTTTLDQNIYVQGVQSNYDAIYILGVPNNWFGPDLRLSLISDYTWRIPLTITDTTEWKFNSSPDWSGQEFTDTNCDGVLEMGGGNINCGAKGRVFVYFNDQDLTWWTEEIQSTYDEMYIMGDMNGWAGPDLKMTLVDDYVWQVDTVTVEEGNQFKFANTYTWSGKDWGDADCDGFAEEATGGGANTNCNFDGRFNIRFNDQTTAYELIED